MTQYKINLNQTTGFSSESTTQHHWTSVHMWMNVFPRLFSFVTFMKNINNSELHAAANRAVCLNLRAIKSARTHTRSWIMSADLWRSACPDSSQSAPTSWPRACVCVCVWTDGGGVECYPDALISFIALWCLTIISLSHKRSFLKHTQDFCTYALIYNISINKQLFKLVNRTV